MNNLIIEKYPLLILQVSMAHTPAGVNVLFGLYYGDERILEQQVPVSLIGIPQKLSVESCDDRLFSIPADLVEAIRPWLYKRKSIDDPLWLQITQPSGYLPLVPWELLLQRGLGIPILRIAHAGVNRLFLGGPLKLAICASAAAQSNISSSLAGYVGELIQTVQSNVPQGTVTHLFVDEEIYQYLAASLSGYDYSGHRVIAYPAAGTLSYNRKKNTISASKESDPVQSPWLRWVRESLQDCSVDAVHFICPGHVARDHGLLVLANSPLYTKDSLDSHFVVASELAAFLNQVDAWSLVLSPPRQSLWEMGIRILAHEVACVRPGPVLFHYSYSHDFQAIGEAYKFLYTPTYRPIPKSGGISLSCDPGRLLSYSADSRSSEYFETSTKPVWEEAAYRILEQHAYQLTNTLKFEVGSIQQPDHSEGVIAALRFVYDLIQSNKDIEEGNNYMLEVNNENDCSGSRYSSRYSSR